MIGLAFASVVTWTVWLAKTIELMLAKRRVHAALERARRRALAAEGVRAARRDAAARSAS